MRCEQLAGRQSQVMTARAPVAAVAGTAAGSPRELTHIGKIG